MVKQSRPDSKDDSFKKNTYRISLFIFTRDLRLNDNLPLISSLKNSEKVIPTFIFNPTQINNTNQYKSDSCVQFMCESLIDLNDDLQKYGSRLYYFNDHPEKVVETLIKNNKNIEAVYISKDYSPFSKKRESDIKTVCIKNKIDFIVEENHMLLGCNKVKKDNGDPYVKFTPYYRVAQKMKINNVVTNKFTNFISSKIKLQNEYNGKLDRYYNYNNNSIKGGRRNALIILQNKNLQKFQNYNSARDYPKYETTKLSPYLKFGCVSVREVYWIFKKTLNTSSKLFTQLYWRDFYMTIIYYFPHSIGGPMKENYKLKWDNDKIKFKQWCNGFTGIPMVDAGMRQLNKTGWMHNRARMIVSNFLIKVLRIDWMWGEKYFASKLIDYDIFNNNMGWQWSSSTGTDSQPYFRIFNPWRQAEKYDHNCDYIKKWIPELRNVPNNDILNWDTSYKKYRNTRNSENLIKYPKPIIDNFKSETEKTIIMYKNKIE